MRSTLPSPPFRYELPTVRPLRQLSIDIVDARSTRSEAPTAHPQRQGAVAGAEKPTVRPQRRRISRLFERLAPELLDSSRHGHLDACDLAVRVGADTRRVVRLVPDDRLRHLPLDPRKGFILSLVDGRCPIQTVLDASAMPQLEALQIVCELMDAQVIGLA